MNHKQKQQIKIMSRSKRAELAQQTVEIVEQGWYKSANGRRVTIADQVAASLRATQLVKPDHFVPWLDHNWQGAKNTQFSVSNETTLACARTLADQSPGEATLCLNFASAKNPGGGFLGGSQAQEESLARSSALVTTLESQWDYYQINRDCHTAFYTDHMILSPSVPVFRDDDGTLLDKPYLMNFVTAPAVNAGAVIKNESTRQSNIEPTMANRINKLLSMAAHFGFDTLILGAWGCGVFRNDPAMIARLFAEALNRTGRFVGCFAKVHFAVLDKTEQEQIVSPFRKWLTF